jgi:hypothetical protein
MIDQDRTNVRFGKPALGRFDTRDGTPEHRPSMRRATALLVIALLATVVVDAVPRAALGNHGGHEIGSLFTCDRPVTPPRCTSVGDGLTHHVAFDASLTVGLADALRRSMAEAYDEPTKLRMIVESTVSKNTDAIAFSDDYGENGAAGWVYCPTGAPLGVNPSGDRWCRHQEIHFNLNPRYAIFFADDASRQHVTCHELGHTLGLRHWGNPPQTDGPDIGATCMNANTPNGPTHLHQFDIDHINAYDYRRTPLPASASGPPGPPRLLPWRGIVASTEVEPLAATLGEMVDSADAVVRGRIVAVAPGRVFGSRNDHPLHYASATLQVESVLAGALPAAHRSSLTLEIPLFDGPASIADLPVWGESVFLLRNKGTSAREAGASDDQIRAESAYYRLLTFTALVVNDGGIALAADEPGPLARLTGRPFDAVAAAIRDGGR